MNVQRARGSVALTPSAIIIPGLSAASVWTASSSAPMAAPASVSAANSLSHSVRVLYTVCVRLYVYNQLQESRPLLKDARQEVAFSFPSQQHVCVSSVVEVHQDMDHCQRGTHNCDVAERALCSYTGGSSYICSCLPGFTGDGRACRGRVPPQQLCAICVFCAKV